VKIVPPLNSIENNKIIEKIQKEEGYFIIKQISSFLPKFDNVGHNILHANDELISLVINNNIIPHDIKQSFILSTIKLSMMGDQMGSVILQLYYDIVKNCF
jgi:hypothetical protein